MTRYIPSPLWQDPPRDGLKRLSILIERLAAEGVTAKIWFRADDIALPGQLYGQMLDAFRAHDAPLALAVVPTWLPMRFTAFSTQTGLDNPLWCLHQHGFRHVNHEPSGKKHEFGPTRPAEAKAKDIQRGRGLLEDRLGTAFFPMFTPPWNRCDAATLDTLRDQGFKAVSRTPGATPLPPPGLDELRVNVDLHTRKEPDAEASFAALLGELENALRNGFAGVMLHHQRMNPAALSFLNALLTGLKSSRSFTLAHPSQCIQTR
jgi:hypothetical protein